MLPRNLHAWLSRDKSQKIADPPSIGKEQNNRNLAVNLQDS